MDRIRLAIYGAVGIGIALAAYRELGGSSSSSSPPASDAATPTTAIASPEPSATASASPDADALPNAADATVEDSAVAATETRDAAPATSDASARADAGSQHAMSDAGKGHLVTVGESQKGQTVELARGDTLVVSLAANPGSGFDWAVLSAPGALGKPAMTYVAPGGDDLGAQGQRKLAFTVSGDLPASAASVELGYQRSFEQGKAPFKTFQFKVRGRH